LYKKQDRLLVLGLVK